MKRARSERLPRHLATSCEPIACRGAAWTALLACAFGLAACGGGGGGSAPSTALVVKVGDDFGAPVVGAVVDVSACGIKTSDTTNAAGVAVVAGQLSGCTADVTVSGGGFVEQKTTTTVTDGGVNDLPVTLDRVTSAAGGSIASRGGVLPVVDASGQRMTFEVELIVVDHDSVPIENLTAADFTLKPCTPEPGTTQADCVLDTDAAYTPLTSAPEALQSVAGMVPQAHAAALLLDQSGSIRSTDPSGARLYSAKAFITGMGADDRALIAALANGPGAQLPTLPLTVYGPSRDKASAPDYFSTLDELAQLVGGATPLYASLDQLLDDVAADTTIPAGLPRSVVVFTDGNDTTCGDTAACAAARAQSIVNAKASQVRIFSIGLSTGVDIQALGEMANETGGALLYAETADQLIPLYGTVGRLLSLSLPTYRLRWTVQADAAAAFVSRGKLLGKVRVTADGSSFDVPIIVGIP